MRLQVISEEPLAQSGNHHGSIFSFSHRHHEPPHPAPNAFMAQLKFSSRKSDWPRKGTKCSKQPDPSRFGNRRSFVLRLLRHFCGNKFSHFQFSAVLPPER